MDTFITGILLGAGTLCGFALIALIWRGAEYLIVNSPTTSTKSKNGLDK